ncbi:hypothetical protein GCM10011519_08310 [Marmoricola endophyticus]|uniref:Uncharacterized protein n=1 Tax=Marmoricola endophyticus TaxID=2040280 RepID=A0A917BD44_9ACTN|nr:hypothetical protein [Marmoricola endophyticus]GGF37134.1 hypothetical protein GCM10011519_08310 [Marmoricola endophyticus]
MQPRRAAVAALTALTALTATALCASACGGPSAPSSAPAPIERPYVLPTSDARVPLDGISWMQGTTLHVDGRSVDVGVHAESYALVPDGVLLVARRRLWFSDSRSAARPVGDGVVAPDGPLVSPDGHHVAFLDDARGPVDRTGERFYRLDVLDTRTGRQTVASTEGMGDLDEYRAEQYEDADPAVRYLDDRAAYVDGIGGSWAYPLDGSRPRRVSEIPPLPTQPPVAVPGETLVLGGANYLFSLRETSTGRRERFTVPGVATANKFALGGWLGPRRFWGFAFHGRYAAVLGRGRMVSCSVASRSCRAESGLLDSTGSAPVLVGGAPPTGGGVP